MGKVLHAGCADGLARFQVSPGGTYYTLLNTALFDEAATTEANAQLTYQTAGTLSGLSARVPTNSLSTAAITITSRKNTAAGGQTISIAASTTGWFTDSSNTDTIAAGDEVGSKVAVAAGGSGTANILIVSANFAATSGHSILYAGFQQSNNYSTASTTFYIPFTGDVQDFSVEVNVQQSSRVAGTLEDLSLYVSANARSTTTTIRSRVNTANGNQVLSVGASTTGWFQDTSNTDTIASGDEYNASFTTGTGTGGISWKVLGATFTSSGTNNDVFLIGNTGAVDYSATTGFFPLSGSTPIQGGVLTTESSACLDHNFAGTASKLRCYVDANTTTGAVSVRFRKNAGNGNQLVSVTAATTGVFEDSSNSDAFAATDDCCYSVSGGTSGNLTFKWWGMTETGSGSFSQNMTETITLTDTVRKGPLKTLEDIITLTDTFTAVKIQVKNLLETIVLTDTMRRISTKTLEEVITLTDTIKRVGTKTLEETITLTDTFVRVQNKNFSETITLVDTLTKTLNGFVITLWKKIAKPAGDLWTKISKPNT